MLVSFTTKGASPVGLLAGRADGSLGMKRRLDTVRLPLDHADGKRLVDKLSLRVSTVIIERDANIGRCPRWVCVCVPHPAHVSSLIVFLAFFADRQAAVRKLDIQGLVKTWRGERKDVPMRELLGIHHLLL